MTGAPAFDRVRTRLAAAGLDGHWIVPGETDGLRGLKGAYVLTIQLDRALPVGAGRESAGHLPPGTYLYAGSAHGAGGLAARLRRHFRTDKKIHWHIDRLTLQAGGLAALAVVDGNECRLVAQLLSAGGFRIALDGFGSTDCRTCRSHLLTTG